MATKDAVVGEPPKTEDKGNKLKKMGDKPLNGRTFWTVMGSCVALLGLAFTLHAQYIIPAILKSAGDEAEAKAERAVDRYASYHDREFDRLINTLQALATKDQVTALQELIRSYHGGPR